MSTSSRGSASYHHGDLREALIGAGLAILEETGDPVSFSLREAARRAGVSAMAPYRHFPDKHSLLAALAVAGYEHLRGKLIAANVHSDRKEALIGQGVAYVSFAVANPALFRLMYASGQTGRPEALVAASVAAFEVLAGRVASLVEPATAEVRALECWSTAHGLAVLAIDGVFSQTGEAAEVIAERVLRMVGEPLGRKNSPSSFL